jgi:glutamate carboxypeptidase
MDFDLPAFHEELEFLVNIDSGSRCLKGVERVTDWFSERYRKLGWPVTGVDTQTAAYGKSAFTWTGDPERLDLLIICHTDTVFPEGTVENWRFEKNGKRITGPGVADMKAGCLVALHAIEQLVREDRLKGNLGVILNGEHELSCPTIRPFLERVSRRSKVVITTEPARANGSCVRQRKGILRYSLGFKGKTAHSGVNPEAGACAVTEMAQMIVALKQLEEPGRGITVNPGIVHGGTSINAVPDAAELRLDIRVVHQEDGSRVDEAVRALASKTIDPGVRVELEGGITRPPMTPTARTDALIEGINGIGRNYGIELTWGFSGGGSDASFASALGIPSLCGLGPVGGNYHTPREYLDTIDLPQRMCIFRDMVEAITNQTI